MRWLQVHRGPVARWRAARPFCHWGAAGHPGGAAATPGRGGARRRCRCTGRILARPPAAAAVARAAGSGSVRGSGTAGCRAGRASVWRRPRQAAGFEVRRSACAAAFRLFDSLAAVATQQEVCPQLPTRANPRVVAEKTVARYTKPPPEQHLVTYILCTRCLEGDAGGTLPRSASAALGALPAALLAPHAVRVLRALAAAACLQVRTA